MLIGLHRFFFIFHYILIFIFITCSQISQRKQNINVNVQGEKASTCHLISKYTAFLLLETPRRNPY